MDKALEIAALKARNAALNRQYEILADRMSEIYAHTLAPDGHNPDQPLSIREICEDAIRELSAGPDEETNHD